MAVKITHKRRAQQVRFATHEAAVRYAERHGGIDMWTVLPIGVDRSAGGWSEAR